MGKLSSILLPVLYLLVRPIGYISSLCSTEQYTICTVMVCPEVYDFPVWQTNWGPRAEGKEV